MLAFLARGEDGQLAPVALSYGTLYPQGKNALEDFRVMVRAALAIQEAHLPEPVLAARNLDWLVEAAVRPEPAGMAFTSSIPPTTTTAPLRPGRRAARRPLAAVQEPGSSWRSWPTSSTSTGCIYTQKERLIGFRASIRVSEEGDVKVEWARQIRVSACRLPARNHAVSCSGQTVPIR